MKAAGISTSELARQMGVSYQAVKKVMNGGSFGKDNNVLAAKILGVHSDWLATGKGPKKPTGAAVTAAHEEALSEGATTDLTIPQYAAGGAMGNGLVLEDKPPGLIKSWRVDDEWLRLNVRQHTGVANLCIVTGFGPSMRGMFNPGDPLLCDRGVTTVDVDGVYFFRVGEHGFIKMLQRIPTTSGLLIRAKSKNPDYDPFDISEGMDFQVFAKVLTVWKSEQQ